jgi:hypothetical protein
VRFCGPSKSFAYFGHDYCDKAVVNFARTTFYFFTALLFASFSGAQASPQASAEELICQDPLAAICTNSAAVTPNLELAKKIRNQALRETQQFFAVKAPDRGEAATDLYFRNLAGRLQSEQALVRKRAVAESQTYLNCLDYLAQFYFNVETPMSEPVPSCYDEARDQKSREAILAKKYAALPASRVLPLWNETLTGVKKVNARANYSDDLKAVIETHLDGMNQIDLNEYRRLLVSSGEEENPADAEINLWKTCDPYGEMPGLNNFKERHNNGLAMEIKNHLLICPGTYVFATTTQNGRTVGDAGSLRYEIAHEVGHTLEEQIGYWSDKNFFHNQSSAAIAGGAETKSFYACMNDRHINAGDLRLIAKSDSQGDEDPAAYYFDEYAADSIAAEVMAEYLNQKPWIPAEKVNFLKQNLHSLCSDQAGETITSPFDSALHPSGKFRIQELALQNTSLRASLGCSITPKRSCSFLTD